MWEAVLVDMTVVLDVVMATCQNSLKSAVLQELHSTSTTKAKVITLAFVVALHSSEHSSEHCTAMIAVLMSYICII